MSEDKTPFIPAAANDETDCDFVVRDGEVWLVYPDSAGERLLGAKEAVFTKMAELLAAEDFGE